MGNLTTPGTNIHGPEIVALTLRVPNPDCACDDARKLQDKSFPVADVPKLPFKTCDRGDCRCRYDKVVNRRKGERRTKADRRDEIRFQTKSDRRAGRDRRKHNSGWGGSSV